MCSGFIVGKSDENSLMVSHLLFVDDTLIFCDADSAQISNLRQVFTWFEVVSGLKINLNKSEIVSVGDVPNIKAIRDILGCKLVVLPMKDLSLFLGVTFKDKHIWNSVLEKVERRLAGWNDCTYQREERLPL